MFELNQRSRLVYIAALVEPANERDQHPALSFVAAYATYTETMNALKACGFTGPKDYQARSAVVLARTMR